MSFFIVCLRLFIDDLRFVGILTGFSESVPPELAALAQDVVADVKSLVGPAKFGEAYGAVRARVMAVRRERKRKRVTEKILDPQVRKAQHA